MEVVNRAGRGRPPRRRRQRSGTGAGLVAGPDLLFEPFDVLLGLAGRALGLEELLLGGVVSVAAGPLFGVVGVLQVGGQCGQAPRGRLQVKVLPRQVFLEPARLIDAGLLCLHTEAGDVGLAGDVVGLPPEAVELVFQFGAQGAVVAADRPLNR